MAVDEVQLLPIGAHLIGNPNKTATGSYHLRPFGRPLIEGFFGGRLAHELEAAGPGAFFDFAVAELVELFGSGIRARLHRLVETGWASSARCAPTPMVSPRAGRHWRAAGSCR